MKNFSQTKLYFNSVTSVASAAAAIVAFAVAAQSSLGYFAEPPFLGPINGGNGGVFPSVRVARTEAEPAPKVSRIQKHFPDGPTGKPHYYWDQQFRSAGYQAMMSYAVSAAPTDSINFLLYGEQTRPDTTPADHFDERFERPSGITPEPTGTIHGLAFGARLPISLFASVPGDFLDPSPTVGGTAVPLLPPGGDTAGTGWKGLTRPTLNGAVDLVTGVPLARIVDLELPFDGATFRVVRTRSSSRLGNDTGSSVSQSIGDDWWDWSGLGWMTGENPLLLIDSCVPDMSPLSNRTTWLVLDAFHSIPFQFIESAGQYEAPPRFRATLTHDGAWGVFDDESRGWRRRPRQYTVSLYDGMLHYTFVAIQNGGVSISEEATAEDRTNLAIADMEDVPPHIWDTRAVQGTHGYPWPFEFQQMKSTSERWLFMTDAVYRSPYSSLYNPGHGLPTLGICTRIEDNYDHIVEMNYAPVTQTSIRDLSPIVDNVPPGGNGEEDPGFERHRDPNYTEVFQDSFRRGQLHYIELKKRNPNNSEEEVKWTLLYAHRRFEGSGGEMRQAGMRVGRSAAGNWSEWLLPWLGVPATGPDPYASIRDDLDCYDGSLAIEAIYAYEGPVDGIDTVPPLTVSQRDPYPVDSSIVVLDASDDPLIKHNTQVPSQQIDTNWTHRVRHFYRYDTLEMIPYTTPGQTEPEFDTNLRLHCPLGAPILIKTLVQTRQFGLNAQVTSTTSRNTIYQYSNPIESFAEIPVGPVRMRHIEQADTQAAAGLHPWSERQDSPSPWLDRIFTDDDVARIRNWGVTENNSDAAEIDVDDIAANWLAHVQTDQTAFWKLVSSFASVQWDQSPTGGWSKSGSSDRTPAFDDIANTDYVDIFNENATHLFGGDNSRGTVSRFVMRSNDKELAYQLNRAIQGPLASVRTTGNYPGDESGFLESVENSGAAGNEPMRSRFVSPYQWSAFPPYGSEGQACWGTPPDLALARWVTLVDQFDSQASLEASASYGTDSLRPGMVGRQVFELNPSGVTIRQRSWNMSTGQQTTVQNGFTKTYKYELAGYENGDQFKTQIDALVSGQNVPADQLMSLRREMLLVEERSIGWSAVPVADQNEKGQIVFHEYDFTPFPIEASSPDPDTGVITYTPAVPFNSFIQCNRHGIKRGVNGERYYTSQVFRALPQLRLPNQVECEVEFAAPRTVALSDVPEDTLSTPEYRVTHYITEYRPDPEVPAWEQKVRMTKTIGPGRNLYPSANPPALAPVYFPVEARWTNENGESNWSCIGLVRNPKTLIAESGDTFESLIFSHAQFNANRITASVEDVIGGETFDASTPGRTTGSNTTEIIIEPLPEAGLSRIPASTTTSPALQRATVYAYGIPGGSLSDIWFPDGRRFAKRIFEYSKDSPVNAADEYKNYTKKGWRETFTFNDLEWETEGSTWKPLKPGQWELSASPAQAAGMSGDGVTSGMWEPLPSVSLTVDFASIPNSWLLLDNPANISHISLPEGGTERVHLDFGVTSTNMGNVLSATTYGLDGNGRLAKSDSLERDPTGVRLAVGTKEVNDLVDVLREREIDGTITRTTRDFFGHPQRKYVGTNDSTWLGDHTNYGDNMVMLERQEYGKGEGDAWQPTVHRRYTAKPTSAAFEDHFGDIVPGDDPFGIATVTSYDWRMRPVRVDTYAKGVFDNTGTGPPAHERRLSTKLTYLDHGGRTRWEVTYGADPIGSTFNLPASLDPSKLGDGNPTPELIPTDPGAFFALNIQPTSLVENTYAPDGSVQETRNYDLASASNPKYQSSFTFKGIGGQEVYAQRPGQPIQIQVLHPAGHLLSTISVRPDAGAISSSTRYELSRTDLVYDNQLNVVERVSYERSVYDSQIVLSTSNAVVSRQWSWYDRAKRLVATADFGTETFSGTPPQRSGASEPTQVTGFPSSATAQINLFEYDTAGNQVASTAHNGKRTEKTYTGTGKVHSVIEDAGPSATSLNRSTTYEYKWGRLAAMKFDREHGTIERTQTTRLWFAEGNGSNNGLGVTATNVVDDSFTEVSQNGSYIGKVWFPHRETGAAGNYPVYLEDFNFKYNFAGQIAERRDARDVVFRYIYDDLGRLSQIGVGHYVSATFTTGYPSGMNCATGIPQDRIEEVSFSYDDRGNQILVTAKTADGMITQNQFDYSQRDDLIREYQAFGGEVVASGTDPTPAIDYAWSWEATNGTTQVGHHRLTSMTYPAQPNVIERRVVGFNYGSSSGTANIINEKLSRITSMTATPGVIIAGTNVADFDWSGTGRRVKQSMGAGRIVRDTRAAATDVGFTNLDHFGRMKDFAFRGGAEGSASFSNILYRAQYGYDTVGNRTSSEISEWDNTVPELSTNDQSVESIYDALNRLTETKTGALDGNGHAVGVLKHTDKWTLDLLGNWVGNGTYPGRESTRDLGNNAVETRSSTHTINERNELSFVDFAASSGATPPPPVDTTTLYDQSGNLVYDGTFFYQYDAWGRLIQINQTTLSETQIAPASPTPCPLYNFTIGAMIKHFTYDGLGRLVRVQSPWPDAANANGGVRSERFYYDGARRIQELVTDPIASIELVQGTTPQGENLALGETMVQTVPTEVLATGDGSATPLSFESAQLNNPQEITSPSGEPLPTSLSGLEREYVWGPGDNGLDEILVQYDIERKAFWMIQDGGGDVVAMCDLQGSGGTARIVKSWQYDAYGQCLRATDVVTSTSGYTIPLNRIGHKGLFMDRLDKGLTNYDPVTGYTENLRLEPFSTVLYQNRNRTYSPQLGRFIQRDPNETAQLLGGTPEAIGGIRPASIGSFGLAALYRDGGSLCAYLRCRPLALDDPLGLYTQADGYAVEWQVQQIYLRDHPGNFVVFGNRATPLLLTALKPDIINFSTMTWLEVKPLSPSGIARAATQGATYLRVFAAWGIYPETTWTPSTRIIYANGKIFSIFNVGGIIFYSSWKEVEEEVVFCASAAIAWNAIKLARSSAGRLALNQLLGLGARAPALVGAAATGAAADAEAGLATAGSNATLGYY